MKRGFGNIVSSLGWSVSFFCEAIRMFELAQTLPGAGVDFKREKQGTSF